MAEPAAPAPDPAAMLRSERFVGLLLLAAVVGVVVSLASWGFLELIHQIQVGVFTDLPSRLGFGGTEWWWLLVVLGLAGLPVAFAIVRLPGNGGHVPAGGLKVGSTEPNMVPGVALAALATIGLGLVLGPEAPLIAIGSGLAVFVVKLAKRDTPPLPLMVLGAAGAFAAISVIFGSPVVAAILIIEASGLGGETLPLILIPGLLAAGLGSLVFIGMGHWTGLSTSAYALVPLHLPAFSHPTWEEIGWTILIGLGAAIITSLIRWLGLRTAGVVPRKPFILIPAIGLVVAGLAIAFDQITGKGVNQVLFSGQSALPGLVEHAAAWSLGALALLFLFKGLAWSLCLGSYRGGPTFPAIFLGAAGGIAATHLPGMPSTPAIAVGMGVMIVAYLKLPLSALVIATTLTVSGGVALALESRFGTDHTTSQAGQTATAPDSSPPGPAVTPHETQG